MKAAGILPGINTAQEIEMKKRKRKNIEKAAKDQRDTIYQWGPSYASGAFNIDPLRQWVCSYVLKPSSH